MLGFGSIALSLLLSSCVVIYVGASDVIPLRDAASQVLDSPSVWAVFSTQQQQQQQPLLETVATLFKGIHFVGVWDESTTENIPAAWKRASPTSVLIYKGDDKHNPNAVLDLAQKSPQQAYQDILQGLEVAMEQTLQGRGAEFQQKSQQSSSSSSSSSQRTKKGQAVIKLDSSNFHALVMENPSVVAVAFTAPWCGHCHKLEPEWKEAAEILAKDDVVMGWVDATAETELAAQYQVQGYPTIKIFPGGTKSTPYDYPAERSAGVLVEFLLEEVERSGVPKPVPELVEPSQLQEACSGSNHLCVLAALPHILDTGAAGRQNYLQSLAKVARTFRKNFSFLWFEGGSGQTGLEEALGLTFGFPALVAISLDRHAMTVMHGAFRDTNVQTFLHGITTGRQVVVPLTVTDLPVSTTTPWDGKDGQPFEEEDDFDLEAFLKDEM